MEDLVSQPARFPDKAFWAGRSVLVTGHTGFKGSWLSIWLCQLGAKVAGLSQEPPTIPNLYQEAGLASLIADDRRVDIRDYGALAAAIAECRPSVVFHLAAQSLVRDSYLDPLGTFLTNVLGTAHVLEAARHCAAVQAVVVVTTESVMKIRSLCIVTRKAIGLAGTTPTAAAKPALNWWRHAGVAATKPKRKRVLPAPAPAMS